MQFRAFAPILFPVVLAACGGGGTTDVQLTESLRLPEQPAPPTPEPEEQTRPFRMSATPVQMIPVEDEPFRNGHADFTIESMAGDVDVVALVMGYFGIPYELFADGTDIPEDHAWTVEIDDMLERARTAGKPVMLQLDLVRSSMIGQALDVDGKLVVDLTWAPPCYDFAQPEARRIGDAYVNFARWITERADPMYVVTFAEANIYFASCGRSGEAWDQLVDVQRRSYDAVKEVAPDAVVFASFNTETLYGNELDGWDEAQYQEMARMAYDVFAVAVYPFGVRKDDGSFATPYDLPHDYISRVYTHHPEEKRLAIAETGWNSVSIAVGTDVDCIEDFPYSEEMFPVSFLEFLLNDAFTQEFALLNWFSFRDSIPAEVLGTCYIDADPRDIATGACGGDFWCRAVNFAKADVRVPGAPALFSEFLQKGFGGMGLLPYEGTGKDLVVQRWRDALALPFEDVADAGEPPAEE
jgi:hypothetical protein